MNESDVLRYKNRLLAKQQELTTRKNSVGTIPTADEPRGDPVDVAASETGTATQIRLREADSKLLRAIEDALTRIRQGRIQQPVISSHKHGRIFPKHWVGQPGIRL